MCLITLFQNYPYLVQCVLYDTPLHKWLSLFLYLSKVNTYNINKNYKILSIRTLKNVNHLYKDTYSDFFFKVPTEILLNTQLIDINHHCKYCKNLNFTKSI